MQVEHLLLIMVDGLGLPPTPLPDSVYRDCPTLRQLFDQHTVPLDATLGVSGLPQSATGQTALLTGVNAAKLIGSHLSGFPNARLRELVQAENIFGKLTGRNISCTFANAYVRGAEVHLPYSLQSVTTVAATSALPQVRRRRELLAGKAVYHDLTRRWLRGKGDHSLPAIDETTAAAHLMDIVRSVDFTLFEYFLTDHVGHRGSMDDKLRVLNSLDTFLSALWRSLNPTRELMLLVSDHGNIEHLQDRYHSLNPVPWCAVGVREEQAREEMRTLLQVTPKIMELLA